MHVYCVISTEVYPARLPVCYAYSSIIAIIFAYTIAILVCFPTGMDGIIHFGSEGGFLYCFIHIKPKDLQVNSKQTEIREDA